MAVAETVVGTESVVLGEERSEVVGWAAAVAGLEAVVVSVVGARCTLPRVELLLDHLHQATSFQRGTTPPRPPERFVRPSCRRPCTPSYTAAEAASPVAAEKEAAPVRVGALGLA